MKISYHFTFHDQHTERFDIIVDERTMLIASDRHTPPPSWAALEYRQCEHCPLDTADTPTCPVAILMSRVMYTFERANSYDEVDLLVEMPDRRVTNHVSVQQAISSMMGLLFAGSGCPHTDFMKPMARFHLPLANEEDTIFRATGMYLIAQYYRKEAGLGHDLEFEGLKNIYANLHRVNTGITDRIRQATQSDSSLNAVVLLDMLTHLMPFAIEDKLDELRHLFHAYVSDGPLD